KATLRGSRYSSASLAEPLTPYSAAGSEKSRHRAGTTDAWNAAALGLRPPAEHRGRRAGRDGRRARAGDRLRRLERSLDGPAPPLRARSRRRVRRSAEAHGGSGPAPPRAGAAPLRSGAESRHAPARRPAPRRKPAHRLALHAGVPDGVGRRVTSTVLARGSSPTAAPPDSSPRTRSTPSRRG